MYCPWCKLKRGKPEHVGYCSDLCRRVHLWVYLHPDKSDQSISRPEWQRRYLAADPDRLKQ